MLRCREETLLAHGCIQLHTVSRVHEGPNAVPTAVLGGIKMPG